MQISPKTFLCQNREVTTPPPPFFQFSNLKPSRGKENVAFLSGLFKF